VDFKHLAGKQVVWTGAITDKETGCVDTYLFFSDETGMFIPDDSQGKPAVMLENAKQTLETIVAEHFEESVSVVALAELLKHPSYVAWANKPKVDTEVAVLDERPF
jgi:hypothetical protein